MCGNVKRIANSVFIIAFITLTACSSEAAPDGSSITVEAEASTQEENVPILEYITTSLSFTEPYGPAYDTNRGWKTEYNDITYCFVNQISEEDRNMVVLETADLIQGMEEKLGTTFVNYTLCMREDYYLPRVQDNTLYIGFENFKTQEFGIAVCQMLFGNRVNYGLLYGFGRELAQERGYPVEEVEELSEALMLCDTEPVYLDMNYACFLDEYTDEQTLKKVKSIAAGFCYYLERNEEAGLLTDYSDEKYHNSLNHFLKDNGKPEYDGSDLDGIWFYNGGTQLRMVWEDANTVFYVEKGFISMIESQGFPEDMLNSGYENLRLLTSDYYKQSQYIDGILGKYDQDMDQKAIVHFLKPADYNPKESYAYYINQEEIRMNCCFPFLHEYIHYMLRNAPISDWCNEMVANYYDYRPYDDHITYGAYADKMRYQLLDPDNPDDAWELKVEEEVRSRLDHDFNFDSPEDIAYSFHADVIIFDRFSDLKDSRSGIIPKYSFFEYLQSLVGEEASLDAVVNDAPEETYGKDWSTLEKDWKDYILQEYGWVMDLL